MRGLGFAPLFAILGVLSDRAAWAAPADAATEAVSTAPCRSTAADPELSALLEELRPVSERYLLGQAPPGPRRRQAKRVIKAFDDELGTDEVRCIPVVVLDPPYLMAVFRQIGGRIGHTFELQGFHARGHIFLRRKFGTVSDAVLVHELLHAISRRFTEEAMDRGYRNLVEGITEYFSIALLTRHLGWKEVPKAYGGYVSFAQALVVRLRERMLVAAYLEDGFRFLQARADEVLGKGVLGRAAVALEHKEFGVALALILDSNVPAVEKKPARR